LTATGGAAADEDGAYRIPNLDAGSYTLTFRYIGYAEQQRQVTLTAGQALTLDVALQEEGLSLNEAVVTASRQQEQVLEAPASVSVIGPQQIQAAVTPSSVGAIRNTTGVDMAQTGVDRQEVVLRGFNNAFSGAAYTLVDYRQAAVASLNVNVFSIMPNQPSDLERVEIVRGPGSALYGPGVDAGVIHFITKDPFTSPGTTIQVTGGERSLFGLEGRHAGTIGSRIGYKFSGAFTRADDWAFDASNTLDSAQLAADFVFPATQQPKDFQTIDPTTRRVQRDYDYQKLAFSGLVQYRLNPTTTLSLNAGHSTFDGIVLSGIGTLQGKGFGYSYGQVRLQSGPFFAQAYVNRNAAGNSYVYGSNQYVVDNGMQFVGQAQYDLAPSDALRVIVGADADMTRPDTEGTILGRNEDDDTVAQLGLYSQATYDLTSALSLTGALRADYNNVIEGIQLSPRAAAVYKFNSTNSARITYNRAFSSPGTNSLFLDIPGRVTSFGRNPFSTSERQFILLGRGASQGYTFSNYRQSQTVRFFLPFDGAFGQDYSLGALPAQPIYLLTTAGLSAQIAAGTVPSQLAGLTAQQRQAFLGVMQAYGQAAGTTRVGGVLGIPTSVYKCPEDPNSNFFAYCSVTGPTDIAPLKQTTTQTAEVGYKGLFGNKLLFEIDGYYSEKKNFIGPLLLETPLAFLQNDAVNRSLEGLESNPQVQAAIQQYLAACGSGCTGLNTAAAMRGLIGIIFARTSAAVVQPDQQPVLNNGTANQVGGFLSYRNFGRVRFWGLDASAQLAPTSRLNLFANAPYVSDDFFDNEELGEAGNANLQVALNAPKFKLKSGASYAVPQSWSANVSVRYQDGFPVASGPYAGDVPSFTLVDVGVGYDFSRMMRGLRGDVLVQN
ncbi:MAG TPA: TonB-dependent receptor, partial [Rhodothermales bacterium]|nr:TonB-dependent receptor [Rhodothermales bacterium]